MRYRKGLRQRERKTGGKGSKKGRKEKGAVAERTPRGTSKIAKK